ncbi:MAG: hypothetical protein RIG82_08245 [Phycisphaeraceae bacterium]
MMLVYGEMTVEDIASCRLVRVERVTALRRSAGVGGVGEVVDQRPGLAVTYEVNVLRDSSRELNDVLGEILAWADGVGRGLSDESSRSWCDAVLGRVQVVDLDQVGVRWRAVVRLIFEVGGLD